MTSAQVAVRTFVGSGAPLPSYVGRCGVTGKLMFVTRRDAKKAIRNKHEKGRRPFKCNACKHFHDGRLPRDVITGRRTAFEIYGD